MKHGHRQPKPKYDVEKIVADMALKSWNTPLLARAAGVHAVTVNRFLRGDTQSIKTAGKLAQALGHQVKRYLTHVEAA